MSDIGVFTPYSTVKPLFQLADDVSWIPDEDRDRLQSYTTYEKIYWNFPGSFRLQMRGTEDNPIYVPSGRTVVDETSHYLLKGLTVTPVNEADNPENEFTKALADFLKREKFYSRFTTAKHSGVYRGDWLMHMTGDPDQPEGRRLSLVSIDPGSYFPIYDPDDVDKIIGVRLVEQYEFQGRNRVKILQYSYDREGTPGALQRRVIREEMIVEVDGWWEGKPRQVTVKRLLKPEPLDLPIDTIPVYHFKNMVSQGDPYGSSELRGHERLLGAINQAISDQELALALMGLGVYATDAPPPVDSEGKPTQWVVTPGVALEVPDQNYFRKVEGITTVTPMLDHIKMLQDNLFEGSSTFRTSQVDVQLAESGIALAIRFMPTMAKIEQRDLDGVDTLDQMFFNWAQWHETYEGPNFEGLAIAIGLGDKLPVNNNQVLNELNNMLDRKIISRAFYREEIARRLGYTFPDNMPKEILEEEKLLAEARMFTSPEANGNGNNSNNSDRTNESNGTESDQDTERQQQN